MSPIREVRRTDDDTYKQRLTHRKAASTWSRVNLQRVPENDPLELPAEYAARLAAVPAALAFFKAQRPSYRRAAVSWVLSAKRRSSRDRRIAQLAQDCAGGQLIRSQRYGGGP